MSNLTTFSGFLYSPYLTPAVSFSVYAIAQASAPQDPVNFQQPLGLYWYGANGGWNMGTNRFVAPFAGVYYTHITLTTANWVSLVCQMDLLLNCNAVMTNSYMTKSQANLDSRSRSFILRLNLGDVLRVRLTSGGYYSTSSLYTRFAGFLIHF